MYIHVNEERQKSCNLTMIITLICSDDDFFHLPISICGCDVCVYEIKIELNRKICIISVFRRNVIDEMVSDEY